MNIREKILVIEDEKSIARFISTILTANGYEAMRAASGAEAMSMISSHCPDLVILDLGLPDMDGLDILRQLRSWSTLPVVVVSARSHEQDKVSALDLGADDYLTKPFGTDELLAQMPADPQCADIVSRTGAKDTYYYSSANMSDNYAMIAQLIEDRDLCVMVAEMVRFNARVYPSATPLRYFRRSPYDLTQEAIEQTWQAMQGRPEYADIEELTNNQNERFLFSTKHLTRRYAKAISDVDEWTD